MKIRSLTLENVRKFGGKRVLIDQIGDGITVVSEANEFGKSTFFDALHAVFFEKHTAAGKSIQSLRPHAGGGVRISADVEIEGARYRVEKRFLSQKGASITDVLHGRVIARDGEAEDWISQHIGSADHGPAGLLWVRQGVVGLEPADGTKTEKDRLTETRRDLLSSVAGEIDQVTGGRTMDRILRRCQDDLNLIATGKNLSPRGAWKDVVESEKVLVAELEQLERQCLELSDALNDRRAAEAELQRLDDPKEKARRGEDVRSARAAAQAADFHVQKVIAATRELETATLQFAEADRLRKSHLLAVKTAKDATLTLTSSQTRRATAVSELSAAREAENLARAALVKAEALTKTLRDEVSIAERAAAARRSRQEAERVKETLKRVRKHITVRAEAKARVGDNPATQSALILAEGAVGEATRLRAALAARAVHMTVSYSGDLRLMATGTTLPGDTAIEIADGVVVEVPGIGEMRFDLPSDASIEDLEIEFADALAAETEALKACGAVSLLKARQMAQARQAAENEVRLADEMLVSLAPTGVDALEQSLAQAQEAMKAAPDGDIRSTDLIASELEPAAIEEVEARARLNVASEKVADARAALASAEAALNSAQTQNDTALSLAGPIETRSARANTLSVAVEIAQNDVAKLSDALTSIKALAPDAATAAANLKRAEAASDAARKRREQLAERRADLSARIDTRAEEGIEERREEVSGRLQSAQARSARYAAEVTSLARLRDELEAARDDARDAYFEPVQDELRPLLRILHDDAGLDWESDTIVPGALRRGADVEAFDTLSGGTQEQIAILTRLAFARLFARRGQHLPIILDDALVYSDDDRIVKMFTALNRVAMDQQIIVFSCRQLAFAGLGGERPAITMQDVN